MLVANRAGGNREILIEQLGTDGSGSVFRCRRRYCLLDSPPDLGKVGRDTITILGAKMAQQYIFTIENISKAYGKKEVLKGIWLSFYAGAKIGVLGGNGSGKSTLLRIMGGLDKDFSGTARPASGVTVGYLPQEPVLDPTKTVLGNVELAVAKTRALLDRFDAINTKLGEPIDADEMDKLLEEQGKVQDAIETAQGWDLDRRLEIAMDAMRLPPGDAEVARPSPAASEAPGRALQDPPRTPRHPPARRAHQPPRRRERSPGSNATSQDYHGHRRRRDPRPVLPRQRGRLDPRTRSGPGHPLAGQLHLVARAEAGATRQARRSRKATAARRWHASWSGSGWPPGPGSPRTAPGSPATSNSPIEAADRRDEAVILQIPPGPHLGDLVVEAEGVKKGYGDRLLVEDMTFRLPPGGIVGIIGPNGAGKTTLFRMIVGQESARRRPS